MSPSSLAVLRCDPLLDERYRFWHGRLRPALAVYTLPYNEDEDDPPPTYFPLPFPTLNNGQFSGSGIRLESDVMPKQVWRKQLLPFLQSEPYLRWSFRLGVDGQEDVLVTFHTPIATINDLLASINPTQRRRVIPWKVWSASSRCITDRPTGVWAAHGTRHLFYSSLTSTIKLIDFSPGAALSSSRTTQRDIRFPRIATYRRKWPHDSRSMGGSHRGQGSHRVDEEKLKALEPTISLQEILGGSFKTVFPAYIVEPSLELPELPPFDEVTMECDFENILIVHVSILSFSQILTPL